MLTKESFIEAGFTLDIENPIFPFTKSLVSVEVAEEAEEEDLLAPEIGFCTSMASFFISDISGNLMYFNAESPQAAVEWANKITSFEPNF